MGGIQEQNRLIAYYTGGTSHAKHIEKDEDKLKIHNLEAQFPVISQPVCERCEHLCLWDQTKGMFGETVPLGVCMNCGTITKKPITFGEYLANGYDIPSFLGGKEKDDSIEARKLLNLLFNKGDVDGRDEILQ